MFKGLIAIALAAWAITGTTVPAEANDEHTEHNPKEIIVKIDPSAGSSIADINATYGTTTLQLLTPGANIYLLHVPAGVDADDLLDRMEDDEQLVYAEPNAVSAPPEADPSWIGAWGGFDPQPWTTQLAAYPLGLEQAHAISRGAGSVVAVVDSGVQLAHPALADHLTAGFDFVDGDALPDDVFNGADDDADGVVDEIAGHGTHVAGIVRLIAPDARIMPLRVLDSDGQGNVWSVVEAITYAADHGADVVNLSLGTSTPSRLLRETVEAASERGVLVVAAAGNQNNDEPQYPAADQCALGVTAIGADDTKSSFASWGDHVDLAAPGEGIYSTFPADGYAHWSGTSMATPFVAAQAALVHSAAPALPARDVAQVIGSTARSLGTANPAYEDELGAGALHIGESVEQAFHGTWDSGSSVLSGTCSS